MSTELMILWTSHHISRALTRTRTALLQRDSGVTTMFIIQMIWWTSKGTSKDHRWWWCISSSSTSTYQKTKKGWISTSTKPSSRSFAKTCRRWTQEEVRMSWVSKWLA
jgi:hypothetical protein